MHYKPSRALSDRVIKDELQQLAKKRKLDEDGIRIQGLSPWLPFLSFTYDNLFRSIFEK